MNPSKWWKTIKLISGLSSKCTNQENMYKTIRYNDQLIDSSNLPELINNEFTSFSSDVPAFDQSSADLNLLGPLPEQYTITEYSVYCALQNLKVNKATGPDEIPNVVFKSLADLFSAPLCCIINTSLTTGVVPTQWKTSRIFPLPKISPPSDIINHLRPISITPSISKIAERFICCFFTEHFRQYLDPNQFGCIKGRSTILALVKFSHNIFTALDKFDCFVRLLFVDFRKAFDIINHNILFRKMQDINLSPHLIRWLLSFLVNRLQFVSVNGFSSRFNVTNAGTPQGTVSGPNCFNLLINDLRFLLHYIKYVDDTSLLSVSADPLDNSLQQAADELCGWSDENGMRVNAAKTKELLVYFGKKYPLNAIPRITVNNTAIERVSCFKLLGVYFNDHLTWSDHVSNIVAKANKRIYSISQLSRSGVKHKDIITVYCSVIRSVLEYCCQLWHPGLTKQQSNNIEFVQKRCLKIMFPNTYYSIALQIARIEKLSERRERLVIELFDEIKKSNFLTDDLVLRDNVKNLRNQYKFTIPQLKKNRTSRDFITYCLQNNY